MRLIDADYLIDDIEHNLWDWESVDGITASTVLKQTITDINNQPTVNSWKEVYNELTKNEMLCGKYDARTSDAEHFINGVWVVMEYIAERAGHHDEFNEMFMHNVIKSEEKALNAKEKTQ